MMALIDSHLLNEKYGKDVGKKKSFEEINLKKLKREEQTFDIKIKGEKYFFIISIIYEKE